MLYDYNDIPFHPVSRFSASRRRLQEASVRFYLRQISRKANAYVLKDMRRPIVTTEDIDLQTYLKRKAQGYYDRDRRFRDPAKQSGKFPQFRSADVRAPVRGS